MNENNPKIEGSFASGGGRYPDYLNKCGSCGKIIGKETSSGDGEYRRTLNEELFNKTGGREGRIYYCIPCGQRISIEEAQEENRERKRYNKKEEQNAKRVIESCSTEINSLKQKLTSGNVAGTVEDYRKIKARNIKKSW
jgi:hypothetical protein